MFNFKTLSIAALFAASAFAQFSTPVRDVEHPVRNAVLVSYNCTSVDGCTTDFVIPTGHRLAITQISFGSASQMTAGSAKPYFLFRARLGNGNNISAGFPIEVFDTFANFSTFPCSIVVDQLINGIFGIYSNRFPVYFVQLHGYLYKM